MFGKLIGILAASLVMVADGCAAPAPSTSLRSLAKGNVSGIREASRTVIRDPESWSKWWEQHTGSRAGAARLPIVDFEKEMVLAVTLGTKRTGGYAVEVTRASQDAGRLVVALTVREPAPGSMTMQVITSPFHCVAVPRSDLKVEFEESKLAR